MEIESEVAKREEVKQEEVKTAEMETSNEETKETSGDAKHKRPSKRHRKTKAKETPQNSKKYKRYDSTPRKESSDTQTKEEKGDKGRKKKVIVILGYNGLNYQGLQKNPGAHTIEDDLEKALELSGAISEDNKGDFAKIAWTRACRTDKGVHAVGNAISAKIRHTSQHVDDTNSIHLIIDPPGLADRINSHLPPQIRVFDILRTTKGFNAKNAVQYRTYEYILPTFVFAPIVLGSKKFTFDDAALERVNSLLKVYEGTHKFHNFTVGTSYSDPAAHRYMISVTCSKPFEIDGMELVKITLVGQSFMLHQIRKMVSLVVFIVRFSSNENVIHFAFGQHPVNIPLAPGEFLCLENVTRFDALLITDFHKCNFEGYNKKLKTGNSPSPPIDMSTIQGRTEFKEKHIYPAVIELERKEQLTKKYLSKLDFWKPLVNQQLVDVYEWLKIVSQPLDKALPLFETFKEEVSKRAQPVEKSTSQQQGAPTDSTNAHSTNSATEVSTEN